MPNEALNKHHVSRHDSAEVFRPPGNIGDSAAARLARLERRGDISVKRETEQMI
jgi:hypothetical protein